jgi:hypothetical protein
MEMKILAAFVGSNRDFRAWLKAGMPANVALEGHSEEGLYYEPVRTVRGEN